MHTACFTLISNKPKGMARGHFYKTNYHVRGLKYKVSEICANNPGGPVLPSALGRSQLFYFVTLVVMTIISPDTHTPPHPPTYPHPHLAKWLYKILTQGPVQFG